MLSAVPLVAASNFFIADSAVLIAEASTGVVMDCRYDIVCLKPAAYLSARLIAFSASVAPFLADEVELFAEPLEVEVVEVLPELPLEDFDPLSD